MSHSKSVLKSPSAPAVPLTIVSVQTLNPSVSVGPRVRSLASFLGRVLKRGILALVSIIRSLLSRLAEANRESDEIWDAIRKEKEDHYAKYWHLLR